MNKLKIITMLAFIMALALSAAAEPIGWIPPPVFQQTNFLRLGNVAEFNIDYALVWTDSAAVVFLQPIDAVVLHVDVLGQKKDVFIISDTGMNRLTVWQCTEPDANGKRLLEKATSYHGEDAGGVKFKHPAGLAVSAVNREFDPLNDVIYVADRANDRIVELAYTPDIDGGKLKYNRTIGAGFLEYPYDIAISAYGDANPANVDLYVVEWSRTKNNGSLKRFSLGGVFEGQWQNIGHAGYEELVIWRLEKPMSVACFPDTITGNTAIYITEAVNNTLFYLSASTDTDPEFSMNYDLEIRTDFWRPGGIALDDHGRVYTANEASGIIEIYGPYINFLYDAFGSLGEGAGEFYYPTNITLDTYHNVCEALILECYGRQSGLQTYLIDGGVAAKKPPLGFVAAGLVRPPVESSSGILPGVFTLNEAYPNPFNSSCLISFAIPERSDVKIDVFNILGQQVTTLLDEARDAGKHSIVFDADRFSSGIYFYRLKTESFSEVKSMTLLK